MTTSASLLTLDVRDVLNSGGEPLSDIMQAVGSLAPGQGLRLFAPFKPVPLFGAMSQQGYRHTEHEIGGGDWEVLFSPTEASGATGSDNATGTSTGASLPPASGACVDLRGLVPPEPMQRALDAVEALKAGESLQVLTDREPTLLHQELGRRYHTYVSESCLEGYRTTIRHSGAEGERA